MSEIQDINTKDIKVSKKKRRKRCAYCDNLFEKLIEIVNEDNVFCSICKDCYAKHYDLD